MADYSTIKGFNVKTLASDPGLPGVAGAAWSSGGNLLTAVAYNSGAGTLTAGLSISGATPSGTVKTQEYDGSTWTEGGDVSAYRNDAGSAGSQTSALFFGGSGSPSPVATTEEYDGTSWTAGGSLSRGAARVLQGSVGANQNAAWVAGGRGSPDFNDLMETYNGTSWTEANDLNTSRAGAGAAGITTAGLLFGGMTGDPSLTGNTNVTEEWDGTSWATSPATLNTTRREMGASGTQTLALCFGGVGPPSNEKKVVTEAFDGSSWTEVADMATARLAGAASKIGTQTASFYAGGEAVTNATEEFTTGTSIAQEGQVWYNSTSKVLKGFGKQGTGAWASGGLLNAMTMTMGTAGTQTATLSFGGTGDPGLRKTNESYNGTTWTELADMQTARQGLGGFGTQTAAMAMGGQPSPSSVTTLSETWNGTSWTEGNDINTGRCLAGAAGITTAGLFYTGTIPGSTTPADCESYDGTCWTETNNVNTARESPGKGGLQSTAMCAAGYTGVVAIAETFDGTCWTEVNDLNTARYGGGYSGDSSQGIIAGGNVGPSSIAEQYDGTSWTEVADLSRGRYFVGGAPQGGSAAGIIIGGQGDSAYPGTASQSVEEWAVPNATKTFTAS